MTQPLENTAFGSYDAAGEPTTGPRGISNVERTAAGTYAVTFRQGTFIKYAPAVVAGLNFDDSLSIAVVDITESGCKVRITNPPSGKSADAAFSIFAVSL